MNSSKPTRRDLFVTIARLQALVGDAMAALQNDRDPNRFGTVAAALKRAEGLAIDAASWAPPITARDLEAPPIGPAS